MKKIIPFIMLIILISCSTVLSPMAKWAAYYKEAAVLIEKNKHDIKELNKKFAIFIKEHEDEIRNTVITAREITPEETMKHIEKYREITEAMAQNRERYFHAVDSIKDEEFKKLSQRFLNLINGKE